MVERLAGDYEFAASDALLASDDTAIAKKGTLSVGIAAQYASAFGQDYSGISDAGARRSTNHADIAAVSSRELDKRCRTFEARRYGVWKCQRGFQIHVGWESQYLAFRALGNNLRLLICCPGAASSDSGEHL